ncbi:hypothetical protein THAOC_02960, partial [Thalassiosira oceanica]
MAPSLRPTTPPYHLHRQGGIAHRVSQDNKLGQLEFKYHLLVEKKRLERELLKFQELYGVIYSEPCLICLDDIHVHASTNLIETFMCCGGFICKSCARNVRELESCPLCRESLYGKTEAEEKAQVMKLAKRGVIWAQLKVGQCLLEGTSGFKKQVQTGLEWVNKAVAENYPFALCELSNLYRGGTASQLGKSEEKANELLLESANLGYSWANIGVAKVCFEMDRDEAYFRASVAFALDNKNEEAARMLGYFHFFDGIPEPSTYLACYYLNIVACEDTTTGTASYLYCKALLRLASHLHGAGADDIIATGFNVLPAAFFWLRKSCELGHNEAMDQLKEWESCDESRCANCAKKVQAGEKLKQCSKCKAQWYCSKECQVEAWRAGHKKDCKRAAIMNFVDYLNAEYHNAAAPCADVIRCDRACRSRPFDELWNPSGAYLDDCRTAAALDRPPRRAKPEEDDTAEELDRGGPAAGGAPPRGGGPSAGLIGVFAGVDVVVAEAAPGGGPSDDSWGGGGRPNLDAAGATSTAGP